MKRAALSVILALILITSIPLGCNLLPRHYDIWFTIGNGFDEPIIIYFDSQKQGSLKQGENKVFYPDKVLTTENTDLLIEAKSQQGDLLYSHNFSWEEFTKLHERLTSSPFVITPGM